MVNQFMKTVENKNPTEGNLAGFFVELAKTKLRIFQIHNLLCLVQNNGDYFLD